MFSYTWFGRPVVDICGPFQLGDGSSCSHSEPLLEEMHHALSLIWLESLHMNPTINLEKACTAGAQPEAPKGPHAALNHLVLANSTERSTAGQDLYPSPDSPMQELSEIIQAEAPWKPPRHASTLASSGLHVADAALGVNRPAGSCQLSKQG